MWTIERLVISEKRVSLGLVYSVSFTTFIYLSTLMKLESYFNDAIPDVCPPPHHFTLQWNLLISNFKNDCQHGFKLIQTHKTDFFLKS